MPVCFGAGDLVGFTHVVVELDVSGFTLRDGDDEYPSFELKVEGAEGSGLAKVINGTPNFDSEKGIAEIPLSSVDFLDKAEKFTLNVRGTGTIVLKNIYTAK